MNETPSLPAGAASGNATEHGAAVDDVIEAWLRFATADDTAADTGDSPVRQVAYGVMFDRRMLVALADALPGELPGLVLATSRVVTGTDEVITGGCAVGLTELNAHYLYWCPALPGCRTGATA